MTISETINSIIKSRQAYLPKISEQRIHLETMLTTLNELDGLVGVIKNELQQQQGDYYEMIAENPKAESALMRINTADVRSLIKEQLKRLDLLEKRFGRDTVCIAMIGYERQGKSTFLQTISGLENDVIPAYSGTSCTGAVSVIHNIDGPFRAEIEMYTQEEFLIIVREKLEKFFPNRNFILNRIEDLRSIDLSGFVPYGSDTVSLTTEFNKFKDAYFDNMEEYTNLLGQGVVTIIDETQVIKHVAQYQEFDEQPEGDDWYIEKKNDGTSVYKRNYYKYIAVKNVHIYKRFNLIDCRQIQLVDTIGMGDANNAAAIEKEMFRVLREDCDAAVNLFKPDSLGGGFNQQQTDILQKISTKLADRNPSKWIVYVINKVPIGYLGANEANIPAILETVNKTLDKLSEKPVAWVKTIKGKSVDEVRDLLVKPLLDLISSNLGELDNMLLQDVNDNGMKLYSSYFKLTSDVESVVSKSAGASKSEGKIFDQLFKAQFKKLARRLRILDEEQYGSRRTEPCDEIVERLDKTINSLYNEIPEIDTIEDLVDIGAQSPSGIFTQCCDELCNNIYESFENVSLDVIIPLRENVKTDLAKALYEEGELGKIPLKAYRAADGASMEWLTSLIAERVNQDAYPLLYDALKYITDYHFNIEDSIEYDVAQSIGIIDKMNAAEFEHLPETPTGTVSERADAIWQEVCNRISPIQINLKKYCNRFALIPSRSFATRVQKFRVKIVHDEKIMQELRDFYRDNCYTIWRDEFKKIAGKEQAFGGWNDIASKVSELCDKDIFELHK